MEELFRLLAAIAVTVAAILTTFSWRKWAHNLIRPGMAYTAITLWVITVYRWWLVLGRIVPESEPAAFIRMFVAVAFIAMSIAFSIHALATREFKKAARIVGGPHNGAR